MAFTATRSPQGIEKLRHVGENEIILWPGDPGVTFTRGDTVVLSAGVLADGADSSASVIGIVQKTIVCPVASQPFPAQGPGGQISDLDGAAAKTLIPIRPQLAAGTLVQRATFANQKDYTVTSYTESTRALVVATGLAADTYGIGGLVYIYDGPGKGQLNLIESYTHTSLTIVVHRNYAVVPDSTSSVIILAEGGAASDGKCLLSMGRLDLDTISTLDIVDGYDDGDYCFYEDWMRLAEHIDGSQYQLTMPFIKYYDFV